MGNGYIPQPRPDHSRNTVRIELAQSMSREWWQSLNQSCWKLVSCERINCFRKLSVSISYWRYWSKKVFSYFLDCASVGTELYLWICACVAANNDNQTKIPKIKIEKYGTTVEYGVTVHNMDMEVWSVEREGSMDGEICTVRLHTGHVWPPNASVQKVWRVLGSTSILKQMRIL